MSQAERNAVASSKLNNIHYEHTISVSNNLVAKIELLAITVLWSFVYFACYKNAFKLTNHQNLIGILLSLFILIRLLVRIFWGVKKESILIVKSLGFQKTTTYHSNFKSSVFIPWHSLNDVIINEAIVLQKVIFYLAVLVKAESLEKSESIIPIFIDSQPRLSELKEIYTNIQLILKN